VINGIVHIDDTKKRREAVVTNEVRGSGSLLIPFGSKLKVSEGDAVEAGTSYHEGSVNPHEYLKDQGR
jgi:DNA-directed RNA polymerase subunit beta'